MPTRIPHNRLTTETFVERAVKRHGDKYNYSKVEYVNSKTKVVIICPEHGEFAQIPANHLHKHGCPICAGVTKSTTKEFITKAKAVHNDTYDYSKVSYTNAKSKITIICKEHGEFTMTPNNHLRGHGCSKCHGGVAINHIEWMNRINTVHPDKYEYPDEYLKSNEKITITCPEHGTFLQTPNDHMNGHGCPKCVHTVSKPCNDWLDSVGLPNTHHHREVSGLIKGRRYTVDGYDPETNTVYEFHGDYWHGNPALYDPDDINPTNGTTYGTLYEQTLVKKKDFESHGYTYVEIWASEWLLTK